MPVYKGLGSGDPAVDHPSHYTAHPSGVECIDITEHMNFNQGNAVKYIWRAGLKSKDPTQDLRKAAFYINREIERLEAEKAKAAAAAARKSNRLRFLKGRKLRRWPRGRA